MYALLGERTAADNEKPVKKKKEKPVKVEVSAAAYLSTISVTLSKYATYMKYCVSDSSCIYVGEKTC